MLHNRREAENGDGDGNSDNNNNNSNNNEGDSDNNNNNNDEAGKRLELIRGRLDFRKIVPPSELPDLERGEERRYDSYVSNSNNNDNNNDRNRNSNSNVSRASLGQLVEMGFGVHASTKALNAVGGSDTESAMNWIFEHSTDPNLNDDPSSNSKTTVTMLNLDAGDDDDVPITPADSNNNNNNNNSTVRSLFSAPFSFFNRVGGSAGGGSVSGTAARNEECCSICLEPFSVGDTVARLKKDAIAVTTNTDQVACNHCFHEDCILEWLQNHDDCPLCRGNMIST